MRVLAYEGRRLLGLRSTWLILLTALVAQLALTVAQARRLAPTPLPVADAVHLVSAAVPVLPVPLAALAVGLLGALGVAHEVRHPGLTAAHVRYAARLRLLVAKSVVLSAVAAGFAVLSLVANALAIRLTASSGDAVSRFFAPGALRTDPRSVPVLLTFTALVVAAGWVAILATALTRSAVAGVLLLCALPTLVVLAAGSAALRGLPAAAHLRTPGSPWTAWTGLAALDIGSGRGGPAAAATVPTHLAQSLATLLLPTVLLLAACLLTQLRRRSL
ncbi:hypothetical protein C7C46_05780 [Streptomyces tateyamensis]|uniref:Uncharacterized protein n=1 Tax=Streptomyces tateyamensis TaxID=565073 RepID=A0A2V4NWU4_9ACTN|nr:hypothetical protein [Streptomyces tateyamensis]PYC86146.1 hypothetical protein C7C46_05780 [Streptomyces tateyamensis]